MKSKLNLLHVTTLLAQVNHFNQLMLRSEEGGQARWDELQRYLSDNPTWKAHIKHVIDSTPQEALRYIVEQFGADIDGLDMLIQFMPSITLPDGSQMELKGLRQRTEQALSVAQHLYIERMDMDPKLASKSSRSRRPKR